YDQGPGYDQGAPQQPWEAGPPPPGGYGPPPEGPPQKSNKGLIIGLSVGGGALVLVLIIIIAAVAINASGGDDDGGGGDGGGSAAQRKVSWTIPEPTSEKEADTVAMFPSADKKTLVRISGVGISGYNMTDGKSKWNISAPGGAQVCSGTREAPDGVAAIIYGTDGYCTTVAAVDVTTGKQLWTTNVKVNDSKFPPRYGSVAAGQGKIWVSTSERVIKYDAKQAPSTSGSAKPV